jgi:hypothetical protein
VLGVASDHVDAANDAAALQLRRRRQDVGQMLEAVLAGQETQHVEILGVCHALAGMYQ